MAELHHLRLEDIEQDTNVHDSDLEEAFRILVQYSPKLGRYTILNESGIPLDDDLEPLMAIASGQSVRVEDYPSFYRMGKKMKRIRDSYSQKIPQSDTPTRGTVYLINALGTFRCKIGITTNLEIRLSQLAKQSPYPIGLEMAFESLDIRRDEKYLHTKFKNKRVFGEWFEFTDEDLFIATDEMYQLYSKHRRSLWLTTPEGQSYAKHLEQFAIYKPHTAKEWRSAE